MRNLALIWLLGTAMGCIVVKKVDTGGGGGSSDDADADTDTDTDSDTDADTDADFDGSLIITSPDDGDVIDGGTVPIEFTVEGCVVGTPSAAPDGCHLHKYLDGTGYEDPHEGGDFAHYDPSGFDMKVIADGSYEFSLILIRNDGSDQPFSPTISDAVTVTVTGMGGGDDTGGSGGDTGGSGGDTGGSSGGDTGGSSGSDTGGSGGGGDTGATGGDTGTTSSGSSGGDDTGEHTADPTDAGAPTEG